MSETKTTGVMWLDAALESIDTFKAAERQAELERKQRKAKAEAEAREEAMRVFKDSLTAVLGEEAASELKDKAEFDEHGSPFVLSGGYEIGYALPQKTRKGSFNSTETETTYALYLRKPIPERLRQAAHFNSYFATGQKIGSVVGIAQAIRDIEQQREEAEAEFARLVMEEERAKLELEPVSIPEQTYPVPENANRHELTVAEDVDVRALKSIINDLEHGYGLSRTDEFVLSALHMAQYVMLSD